MLLKNYLVIFLLDNYNKLLNNDMKIFHNELTISEGFEISKNPKLNRIEVSPGQNLFEKDYKLIGKIKCWCCSLEADRWIIEKHKNDLVGRPILNPYSLDKGLLVMMNRDHIIPKSLGGLNILENLRVSCEKCNSERANAINKQDKNFILNHPHLFSIKLFKSNQEKMEAMIKRKNYSKLIKKKIRKPFKEIEELLKIV